MDQSSGSYTAAQACTLSIRQKGQSQLRLCGTGRRAQNSDSSRLPIPLSNSRQLSVMFSGTKSSTPLGRLSTSCGFMSVVSMAHTFGIVWSLDTNTWTDSGWPSRQSRSVPAGFLAPDSRQFVGRRKRWHCAMVLQSECRTCCPSAAPRTLYMYLLVAPCI